MVWTYSPRLSATRPASFSSSASASARCVPRQALSCDNFVRSFLAEAGWADTWTVSNDDPECVRASTLTTNSREASYDVYGKPLLPTVVGQLSRRCHA